MGSGALPPSQGISWCLTCRIISLLFLQHRTSGDFGRWPCYYESHEHWYREVALTLWSGQPPERGPGCLWNSGGNWPRLPHPEGDPLGNGLLFFEGGREAPHGNSWEQTVLLLCLLWSWSQQRHSEMVTQAPTLGTQGDRALAGLQQEWVAKFKALTNTKMGLRPKRRMTFVFWGSSGCPGVRPLSWVPKNKGGRYILAD